ncbi:hypothetical protein [Pseudacidovorax intermedius]|uniref:hypothetical protein n=1 Tax=Pseudacidovorax intermedius TaxID=433924 RepID=UPI0026EC078A|nr:hypothetical protein [Pseudacidovorax intermedius]
MSSQEKRVVATLRAVCAALAELLCNALQFVGKDRAGRGSAVRALDNIEAVYHSLGMASTRSPFWNLSSASTASVLEVCRDQLRAISERSQELGLAQRAVLPMAMSIADQLAAIAGHGGEEAEQMAMVARLREEVLESAQRRH